MMACGRPDPTRRPRQMLRYYEPAHDWAQVRATHPVVQRYDPPEQREVHLPTFDDIPIASLHFDPKNPRFPKSVEGTLTADVLRFMLQDANLLDLMRSIAAQGFFPGEPLLVSPHPTEAEHWIVVEGNRRLAATLLLRDPGSATTRKEAVRTVAALAVPPDTLPCLQFPARSDILEHLGYRHVTGIKEWEPLAKARYLKERYQEATGSPTDRFRQISRTIGSRSDYVGRLLTALAIYEKIETHKFYEIVDLNESTLEFSLISSVLAYEKIVRFLGIASAQSMDLDGLDREGLEWLTKWVFERNPTTKKTIVGESRNIRVLADVVSHERSLDALKGGSSLGLAAKLSGAAVDSFLAAIGSAAENVSLARNYVDDLDEVAELATSSVTDLMVGVRDLRTALQAREEEVS